MILVFLKLCILPFCFLTESDVCPAWTLQNSPVWQPRRMEMIFQKSRLASFWIEISPEQRETWPEAQPLQRGSRCGEIPPESRQRHRDDSFSVSAAAPHPHLGFISGAEACTRAARVGLSSVQSARGTAHRRAGALLSARPIGYVSGCSRWLYAQKKLDILCFFQVEYACYASILCL